MRNFLIPVAVCAVALAVPLHAARPSCASQGAVHAQDSVRLDYSWPVIYRVYRTYGRCDNNAYFSEAFSTGIIKALAKKWDSLPELRDIAAADPAFLDFVLLHIDATADYAAIKTILDNTGKRCPKKCESLCDRVRRRTARAASMLERMMEEQK